MLGEGGLDLHEVQKMIPTLEHYLNMARRYDVPVIFVQTTHSDVDSSPAWKGRKSQNGDTGRRPTCIKGTWGCEFYGVRPNDGDVIITKHRYSAFVGTNLAQVLNSLGRDSLLLTGVATNVCVESTARDALNHDYHVVLVSDCTATTDEGAQRATEQNIRQGFGWVVPAADICNIWERCMK
ncbi:cysteine hydrolase family protein [Alicyclobacillus fastidiosus]|uniref:cysteine hydrolase family protein n=1 Tax=Alicyclobacillus fastidiosus TaxID=392011 RepID=UPI0024E138D9|nr:cysteine hydrolase [Alicyclobacillus fastidiosus]